MTDNLALRVTIVFLLGVPAFAWADQNSAKGRHGTYTLTDMPGHGKSIGKPLCDASADKILDQWRGSLVIKYSKGTVSVNGEPWIFVGDYPWMNAGANRPPDSSIKGNLFVGFHRSYKRGMAVLFFSDEARTCSTSIAFIGKWVEP